MKDRRPEQVLEQVRLTLENWRRQGIAGFDCRAEVVEMVKRWPQSTVADNATVVTEGTGRQSLEQIRADLGDCHRCRLHKGRRNLVFGEGSPNARLVFVGEGPGYEEDRSGRPFVGPAGRLLDKIIAAMKLDRSQVYICNIVKCRPPANRAPAPDEIEVCLPFLKRQLVSIAPEVICTLGSVAARTLLETKSPVSALRGHFHQWMGIKLMPTFHPAYLLRNPERKRQVWEDVKKIMAFLGIPL